MSVADANQLIQNFNWHNPSWDLFILLFWAVAGIIYAFASGRGRVISMLMSLYIAKLLVLPSLVSALFSAASTSGVDARCVVRADAE